MGLPATSALVAIQDNNGATVNQANGATQLVSPNGVMNFSLQNNQGVQQWEITFSCLNFPSLHQVTYYWKTGQANLIQIPIPVDFLGRYTSTVSDGVSSIAFAGGFVQAKGQLAVPVQHVARLATNAALATYTIASGVITITATGALANIDGVTPAVGDLVLLTMGAAAADNGLYQVTNAGGTGIQAVLTRAPDWGNGALLLPGTTVEVSEGTLFTGMTWKNMTTGTSTVGTTSIALYPQFSTITTGAAVAGVTPANSLNWVFSTTNPVLAVPVTTGGTQGIWKISTQTAGAPGTSSLVATSSSNTDTSTVKLTSINW